MAVTFNASPEAEPPSSLLACSLTIPFPHPNTSILICTSQAGSAVTKEPRQQQFPRGGTDDQPPALASQLPTDGYPVEARPPQRQCFTCQPLVPRKPPSRSVVARIRFCPHHSYSSKRLLFSCSMSTASSSATQEPSLCEEQSGIMRVPGHHYLLPWIYQGRHNPGSQLWCARWAPSSRAPFKETNPEVKEPGPLPSDFPPRSRGEVYA